MDTAFTPLSTGLPGLDQVIQSVMPGDNFVWQVDTIDQYAPFARALAVDAISKGRPVVYFRFASHEPLLIGTNGLSIHKIDLSTGFESATTDMHRIIEQAGRGAVFVFDCISDLTTHWYSDLMLGNFFMLTCPFVYYLDSIAYFAIIHNNHTLPVVAAIRDTTQIIIDVSTMDNRIFIQPLKVWQRNSPAMYLPHRWEEEYFIPVTDSATIAKIASRSKGPSMRASQRVLDIWDRTFMAAQSTIEGSAINELSGDDTGPLYNTLVRMVLTHDATRTALVKSHLTLQDVVAVRERLIGTGLVGGKTLGMLLGRAILEAADPSWEELLEAPDSFYVGSDVFYTYIVANGCWWLRKKQRDASSYLDDIYVARQNMLKGGMPTALTEQFDEMLDYFGQSPIIVRSSSILEDCLGAGIPGIYDSVICINQGSRSERIEEFTDAVRTVYASAMSREALSFRAEHGQLDCDEQMALLVQRISGTVLGTRFCPRFSGTGTIAQPDTSGSLSFVHGLGSRLAAGTDMTTVTFGNSCMTLVSDMSMQADVLDLSGNKLITIPSSAFPPVDFAAMTKEQGPTMLTVLRDMLLALRNGFGMAVEIEFTVNFTGNGAFRINLLQCRPLAT
jgi:pyruvate, water dikinase